MTFIEFWANGKMIDDSPPKVAAWMAWCAALKEAAAMCDLVREDAMKFQPINMYETGRISAASMCGDHIRHMNGGTHEPIE